MNPIRNMCSFPDFLWLWGLWNALMAIDKQLVGLFPSILRKETQEVNLNRLWKQLNITTSPNPVCTMSSLLPFSYSKECSTYSCHFNTPSCLPFLVRISTSWSLCSFMPFGEFTPMPFPVYHFSAYQEILQVLSPKLLKRGLVQFVSFCRNGDASGIYLNHLRKICIPIPIPIPMTSPCILDVTTQTNVLT